MKIAEGSTLVQYVFVDIVRFTQGRTIEAQVDVVGALNAAVLSSLEALHVQETDRILLPTGDGLAIALLQPSPFDLGLLLALEMLQHIHLHNSNTDDDRRRFEVRLGINQNIDNVLTDINGHRNVVGRGINQAQRIMANADGSQILIGSSLYDVLCERESYDGHFQSSISYGQARKPFHGLPSRSANRAVAGNRASLSLSGASKARGAAARLRCSLYRQRSRLP